MSDPLDFLDSTPKRPPIPRRRQSTTFGKFFAATAGIWCALVLLPILAIGGCLVMVGTCASVAPTHPKEAATQSHAAGKSSDEPNEEKPLQKGTKEKEPGLRIKLSQPYISTVQITGLLGRSAESAKAYLLIPVTLVNESSTHKVEYKGAASNFLRSHAILKDNLGNAYRAIDFGLGNEVASQQREVAIYPGQRISDLYIFQEPVAAAKELTLEIEAAALDRQEPFRIRFAVPRSR